VMARCGECSFTFTEPLPVGVTVAGVPGWL
jgi:hypothetical protein